MTISTVTVECLKQYLRKNEFFYRNYIRRANPNKRYPSSTTKITIEGYPRSANTFSVYLAAELIDRSRIASHIHNIACLKASKKRNIPTIILVRSPQASVISWMQKNRIESSSKRAARIYLNQWSEFYTFVIKNLPDAKIVIFDNVTMNPSGFLRLMANLMGNQLNNTDAKALTQKAIDKLENKESQKPWHASSLPKQDRAVDKKAYMRLIEDMSELSRARELYTKLVTTAYKF